MTSSPSERHLLREQLIAEREALLPTQRLHLCAELQIHLGEVLDALEPLTLGFCWPFRAEPDLREFLSLWRAQGKGRTLALPVVPETPGPLSFHTWRPGTPMRTDRFGIPAPHATPLVVPDALLIPVNGFDARGYRIGYGGGFFDRTLAALAPAPVTIGVGFEIARLEDVQPAAHDIPLDWMVTEAGIVRRP